MGYETTTDWHPFNNDDILKEARRLSVLVARKRAHKDKQIAFVAILDFLLGSLHELIRAEQYEFEHIGGRKPELVTLTYRANELANGRWARDGKWMGWLHFNSALVRLAAVH